MKASRARALLIAAGAFALGGCKTWDKTFDTAQNWWGAVGSTLEIGRAAGEDIESVWVGAGIIKGDEDAAPAPAPAPVPSK